MYRAALRYARNEQIDVIIKKYICQYIWQYGCLFVRVRAVITYKGIRQNATFANTAKTTKKIFLPK